jgi:hypothetical protein
MRQKNEGVDDWKNHPRWRRLIAVPAKQDLLHQRMRPRSGRRIQRIRGLQSITPHRVTRSTTGQPTTPATARFSVAVNLMNWAIAGCCTWKCLRRFQANDSKCLFILRQVLAQQVPQSFGLLRTQINPLKIPQDHFIGQILPGSAEDQQKVPYTGAHLHAVGIAIPIIRGLNNVDIRRGMRWLTHTTKGIASWRMQAAWNLREVADTKRSLQGPN